MELHELFCIKERLLSEARKYTNPENFPTKVDYINHLNSLEEGIIYFYLSAMNQILDSMPEGELKKSA